MEKKKVEPEL